MSERPVKIDIDGEKLKKLILDKHQSISTAAEGIGITRQALYGWIRSGKLPLPRLLALSKILSFTADEIRQIKSPNNVALQFRTHRHKEVSDKDQQRVKQIVEEFVLLSKPVGPLRRAMSLRMPIQDPRTIADQIRSVLELSSYPITLEQTLSSAARISLPVVFIPFDQGLEGHKAQGFVATCGDQNLIFLNTALALEDVTWNLFHELTHVFVGNYEQQSKEEEKFCNAVASEVLAPSDFFKRDDIKKLLKEAFRLPSSDLVRIIEEITSYLGASFQGVVLALEGSRILDKKQPASNYLWRVINNRKKHSMSVSDLLTPGQADDPVEFWVRAIQDPTRSHFLRFHSLILHGLLSERVSLARAAEVFKVDAITMRDISLAKDLNGGKAEATH